MPMQMVAPALPAQVQPTKAEPSVFQGINGLLDMDETKGMADKMKGGMGPDPSAYMDAFGGVTGAGGLMSGGMSPFMDAYGGVTGDGGLMGGLNLMNGETSPFGPNIFSNFNLGGLFNW